MRFLLTPDFYDELRRRDDHTPDCYVRPGEYLHHMYMDGIKYVVVPALQDCMNEAEAKNDLDAIRHLRLHQTQYEALAAPNQRTGRSLEGVQLLGDPPPTDDGEGRATRVGSGYAPTSPKQASETGLSDAFLYELILRALYYRNRLTGAGIASELKLNFGVVGPLLVNMRRMMYIDIVGQQGGGGEATFLYELKPPKGAAALEDALNKSAYDGPAPVPFEDYVESVVAQTVKNLTVTRRSIHKAFQDLIITPEVFNEIGPAINSASSIFLFGFPGNGKTSIAERITRLMGDSIYIPYAVEANGAIIKLYDQIVHTKVEEKQNDGGIEALMRDSSSSVDERFIRIKRPTIVVGGELVLPMLDLRYNANGKFYEAPLQMKANGGIFMIDDFGRQQVRPMDLLNRWIVPLEKKYDYLTTITGTKIEVPFDELLIFSTNLDPMQLADEAFLRRIKFKIEVRDPTEKQYRQIWRLVCKSRQVECDEAGVDYLLEKWYKPFNRPMRMCQPRDILDQMICIAKYNMERLTFSPDLIDAGCVTYFVSSEGKNFGSKMRVD